MLTALATASRDLQPNQPPSSETTRCDQLAANLLAFMEFAAIRAMVAL
jgi:hypothetical protein